MHAWLVMNRTHLVSVMPNMKARFALAARTVSSNRAQRMYARIALKTLKSATLR